MANNIYLNTGTAQALVIASEDLGSNVQALKVVPTNTFVTLTNNFVTLTNNHVNATLTNNYVNATLTNNYVTIANGNNYIGKVGVTSFSSNIEFSLSGNSTIYNVYTILASSNSVSSPLYFNNLTISLGGSGEIKNAQLFTNNANSYFTGSLHLYKSTPSQNVLDGSLFNTDYSNRYIKIGQLNFPTTSSSGNNSNAAYSLWNDIPLEFVCDSNRNNLVGILVNSSNTTLINTQSFYISVSGIAYN